jgi:hypothetical protein
MCKFASAFHSACQHIITVLVMIACSGLVSACMPQAFPPAAGAGVEIESTPQTSSTSTPASLASPTPLPPEPLLTPMETPMMENRPAPPDMTVEGLAGLGYDFLYISKNELFNWQSAIGQAMPIMPGSELPNQAVVGYAVDAVHRKVAILRSRGMVGNGQELFDLLYYDAYTKNVTALQSETMRLNGLHLSPDGTRVAYLDNGRDPRNVYIQSLASSSPATWVGECHIDQEWQCTDAVWSADSSQVAWSDREGVWVYGISDTRAAIMITNTLNLADLDGNPAEVQVGYGDLEWSPAGRYLSAWVHPHLGEPRWRGVLDVRTGRVVEIPGTYQDTSAPENAIWMKDNRLLVVKAASPLNPFPEIDIWRLLPANEQLLVLEKTLSIKLDAVTDVPELPEDQYVPSLPAQIGNNRFSLVIRAADERIPPILVLVDIRFGQLKFLAEAPADIRDMTWSPDGTASLVTTQQAGVLLVYASGGIHNLLPLLGDDANHVTWLP